MTDEVAGLKNDGLEKDGLKFGGLRNEGLKFSSSANVSHPLLIVTFYIEFEYYAAFILFYCV